MVFKAFFSLFTVTKCSLFPEYRKFSIPPLFFARLIHSLIILTKGWLEKIMFRDEYGKLQFYEAPIAKLFFQINSRNLDKKIQPCKFISSAILKVVTSKFVILNKNEIMR